MCSPKEAGAQSCEPNVSPYWILVTEMAYKALSSGKLAQHNEVQGSEHKVATIIVQWLFNFLSGEIWPIGRWYAGPNLVSGKYTTCVEAGKSKQGLPV